MSRTVAIVIGLVSSLALLGCGKQRKCREDVEFMRYQLAPLLRHYRQPPSTWPISVPRELVLDAGEHVELHMVVTMSTDSLVVDDERIGDVDELTKLEALLQQRRPATIGFRIDAHAPWAAVVGAIAAGDATRASLYLLAVGPPPDPDAASLPLAKQFAAADQQRRNTVMRDGPSLSVGRCDAAEQLVDDMKNPAKTVLSELPGAIEACGCEGTDVKALTDVLRVVLAPEHGTVAIELRPRTADATVIRLAENAQFEDGVAQVLAAAPAVRLE
jgi:hypothetical protein